MYEIVTISLCVMNFFRFALPFLAMAGYTLDFIRLLEFLQLHTSISSFPLMFLEFVIIEGVLSFVSIIFLEI
jgi:hypothetical protein